MDRIRDFDEKYGWSCTKFYEDDDLYISLGGTNNAGFEKGFRIVLIDLKRFDIEIATKDEKFIDRIKNASIEKKEIDYIIDWTLKFLLKKKKLITAFDYIYNKGYESGQRDKSIQVADTLHELLNPDY